MLGCTGGTDEGAIADVRMGALEFGAIYTVTIEGVQKKVCEEGRHLGRLGILLHLIIIK